MRGLALATDAARRSAFDIAAASLHRLCRWHAATCPGAISTSGGSSRAQRSMTNGQRVWKRQPEGGLSGDGTSPASTISSSRSSGRGGNTAENSAFV